MTCELRGELIVRKIQRKNLPDRRSKQQASRPTGGDMTDTFEELKEGQ